MTTEDAHLDLSNRDRELLTQLVISAFERARAGGKTDWQTMTTAVLKNRLIDLTQGEFDERSFGAVRFAELLQALPETIQVDPTTRPAQVRLIAHGDALDALNLVHTEGRVRDDLWRAIYDYSSDGVYVWSNGSAVWAAEAESLDLVLPTLTPSELDALRSSFVADVGDSALATWAEQRQGTMALPPRYRGQWNALLKRNAIERLEAWFREQGIEYPTQRSKEEAPKPRDETERLRRYLQKCVAVMTLDELRSLTIPLSAAARSGR